MPRNMPPPRKTGGPAGQVEYVESADKSAVPRVLAVELHK
jgi:hypothetical protein